MKQLFKASALAFLMGLSATAALAQNVAIVNGKAVPKARLDALATQIERSGRPVTPEMQGQLREEVIAREIFMQEADKRGLASTDDYRAQMELARQSILIRELFNDFQKKNPVTDAEMKAEYDKFVAANGGDLDWAGANSYVPEFSQAMVKLAKGQTTDAPVKTQFGWHVIRVDDVRETKLPSFEQVKPQMQQQMQQERLGKFQEELRAKAKIE